jgi:hypothetical protein
MVERKKGATGLELERDGRSRGVLGVFYDEERERERDRKVTDGGERGRVGDREEREGRK